MIMLGRNKILSLIRTCYYYILELQKIEKKFFWKCPSVGDELMRLTFYNVICVCVRVCVKSHAHISSHVFNIIIMFVYFFATR